VIARLFWISSRKPAARLLYNYNWIGGLMCDVLPTATIKVIDFIEKMNLVEMVRTDLKASAIMTEKAFENAIIVDMALGGSTNSVLHLLAIATEAGLSLKLEDFQDISDSVPHICDMQPSGPFSMIALYHAGGIPAVLFRLSEILEDAMTVSGSSIRDSARSVRIMDEAVICSTNNPVHHRGV
jgi:dihydroxy-acid dehydratase